MRDEVCRTHSPPPSLPRFAGEEYRSRLRAGETKKPRFRGAFFVTLGSAAYSFAAAFFTTAFLAGALVAAVLVAVFFTGAAGVPAALAVACERALP